MSNARNWWWIGMAAAGLVLTADGVRAADTRDTPRSGSESVRATPMRSRGGLSAHVDAAAPAVAEPLGATANARDLPKTVVLGQLENLYGPVPFDHKAHVKMAEMSGGCVLCHHYTPDGQKHSSCRSCHNSQLAPDSATMPGLKGAYHRQCLSCHQEWSRDTGCNSCHIAKSRHGMGALSAFSIGAASPKDRMPTPITPPITIAYDTPNAAAPVATFHHEDHVKKFGAQCVDCHRDDSCSRCHDASPARGAVLMARPTGEVMGSCSACHNESKCRMCHDQTERPQFDHTERTGWSLEPHHAALQCCQCHGEVKEFSSPTRSCHACHAQHRRTLPGDPAVQTIAASDPGDMDCLSCHAAVRDRLAHATTVHRPAALKDGCSSCHDLSSTNSPRPAADHQSALCLRCHSQSTHLRDGRSVPSIVSLLRSPQNQHRPVRKGRCTACHDPHGSGDEHLLVREYASSFYAPFAVEKYALCFGCHDTNKVLSESSTTVTGFRDGERNLHAVHVNREKGRTCGVCHDPHASKQPFRIREAVPFGDSNWTLRINFQQSASGGRCSPGCHSEQAYDRNRIRRASHESSAAGSTAGMPG